LDFLVTGSCIEGKTVETSKNPERVAFGRIALSAAIWVAFAVITHEFVHRFVPVVGPVPGPGLTLLGAQALVISAATLILLAIRQPAHLISLRGFMATVIWVSLIVFGHYLTHLDSAAIRETLAALHSGMGMGALLASAFMLAVLLGLPFVPSVEMGLMMMTVFGREGAIAAWLATIAGLSLAHAAGRYMPADRVHHWLDRYGLLSANRDPEKPVMDELLERLHLSEKKGHRIGTFLLRHRYLLFAALINLPGNSVLGGGGGIALICGFTRLCRWAPFILTVALASLPIPLLVFLGLIRVDEWLAALGGG
jgi:hypothetical protein